MFRAGEIKAMGIISSNQAREAGAGVLPQHDDGRVEEQDVGDCSQEGMDIIPFYYKRGFVHFSMDYIHCDRYNP